MGRKAKTHEKFIKEVYELVGNEYDIIGTYKSGRTKIEIKHLKCGTKYFTKPQNFLEGSRCPECSRVRQLKTHNQFLKEVYELAGDEYKFLEEYKDSKTKIKVRHNKCGKTFYISPSNFLKHRGCPYCFGNKKLTTKEFKNVVFELAGKEYEVLGEYVNTNKKIKIKHKTCAFEYEISPHNFIHRGCRCPLCFGFNNRRKTSEIFKNQVYNLENNKYEVLEEYVSHKTHILMRHNECGYEYKVTPDKFLQGRRCPNCNSPRGERKILRWLKNNNICFKPQYEFDDCVYKKQLKFDFAIFNQNNILVALIEFDGRQHFRSVKWFGGEEGFKQTKIRDQIKNDYCKENNIPLLHIPYWDIDKINEILNEFINKLKNNNETELNKVAMS